MKAVLLDRAFNPVNAGFVWLSVERMSWEAEGGPAAASLRAYGSLPGLCNLLSFLRYGVRILNEENGAASWWGFVNTVAIHTGGAVYRVSLDGMWNRVAVRYRDENPLSGDSAGWQYQSGWAEDLPSQSLYGKKEQVFTLGEGRADQAAAAAAAYLGRLKLPVNSSAPGKNEETSWVELDCLGWWATLDWQFYAESRGYTGNVQQAVGGVNYPFGANAGQSKLTQQFTAGGSAAWSARSVWLKMYAVGAPADNVVCELLANDFTTVLASATAAGSTISKDSANWYVFNFSSAYTLTNGSIYQIGLRRSAGADPNNYYGVKIEEDALLGGGRLWYWNGAGWVRRGVYASYITAVYGEEPVSAQIQNIAAAAQFITGTLVKTGSGVLARLYRSGKNRMQTELLDLARSGYGSGDSMRLWVNEARQLVVEPRPTRDKVELLITSQGEVRHSSGRALTGGENPVGKWALVQGLAVLGGSAGSVQAVVYVDRAEWADGKLRVGWETGL